MSKRKTVLLTAILTAAVLVPVTSVAAMTVNIELPWTKNIYNVSDTDKFNGTSVSVFDDQDNKCYVVYETAAANPAISCVKR